MDTSVLRCGESQRAVRRHVQGRNTQPVKDESEANLRLARALVVEEEAHDAAVRVPGQDPFAGSAANNRGCFTRDAPKCCVHVEVNISTQREENLSSVELTLNASVLTRKGHRKTSDSAVPADLSTDGASSGRHSLGSDGDHVGIGVVGRGRLVGLDVGDAHFAVSGAEDDLLLGRPDQTRDCALLDELVANALFVSPENTNGATVLLCFPKTQERECRHNFVSTEREDWRLNATLFKHYMHMRRNRPNSEGQRTYQSSPILYTKMMLSVCPMATFVESGEKAKPFTK